MTILPDAFLDSLDGVPGFDRGAFDAVHAAGMQVTSVRLNPGKVVEGPDGDAGPWWIGSDDYSEAGSARVAARERVPWSSWGYYLPRRPSFTLDPLLHAGAYYVQEASSMFL